MTLRRLGRSKPVATVALVAMVFAGVGAYQMAEAYGRQRSREEALREKAARMRVPVELLRDPEKYLRDEARRAEERRKRAVAEMRERYAPNPVGLREHAVLVKETRDRHAASRIGGIVQAIAAAREDAQKAGSDPVARARLEAMSRIAGAPGIDLGKKAPTQLRHAVEAVQKARPGSKLPAVVNLRRPRFDWRLSSASTPATIARRSSLVPRRPQDYEPRMFRASQVRALGAAGFLRFILGDLFPLPAVPLFAVLEPPTPLDTLPTVDAPDTAEIRALAASLGNDPRKIFYWVRSELKTEVYFGSKKGALGTLAERSGNDADQAHLLVALLRAAGYPCRYEIGPMRLSPQQAMDMAGTDTAEAAGVALATSGIVSQVVREGSRTVGVDAVMVWVRTFIPYADWRGTLASSSGPKWVSLMPSLKLWRDEPAVDLREGVDFDFADYMSREQSESPAEVLSRTVLAYARDQGLPCKTVADGTRRRSVVAEEFSILPEEPAAMRSPTLPGRFLVGSDVGADLRHQVLVKVQDSRGNLVIDWSSSMPALYGHTLSLTYEPATAEDAQVLAAHGGIDGTPPWLYRLRPVLRVDGEPVGQGSSDDPGREARVEVILGHPSRYREARSALHPVVVGGVYAFILDAGGDLGKAREASRARMASLPAGDLKTAEKLQEWGLDWFAQRHRAYETMAGVTWNRLLLDVNEAMASLRPRVMTVGGAVVTLVRDRVVFDAGRMLVTPYAIDGDQGRSAFITKLAGHTGSFLEHRVAQGHWNRNQWSAVRVIQRARATGQVVMTIEPVTENLLDVLSAPDDLKEEMRAKLRSGHVVTVPQLPVTDPVLGDLHAYIAVREDRGEGAYVIEGAIDGDVGESGEEDAGDPVGHNCEECPDCCAHTDSSVNLAAGSYTFADTDLTLPARGIPIVFTRTYSSLDGRSRSLGAGWSHSYERRLDEDPSGNVAYTGAAGSRRTWRSRGGGTYEPPPGRFDTLSKDADGFSLESPDGRVERFTLSGELLYEEDLSGNRVTLGYQNGRLVAVTDAAGRLVLSFAYAAGGRLEVVGDVAGREVRYAYSPVGDLASVTDVLGNDWAFTTDASHRMIAKTDPEGGTVTIGYDDQGRVQTVVDRLGTSWLTSYDFANNRSVWTNRRGDSTVFEYNDLGAPTRTTDPLGNVSEREWDHRLNRVGQTDARGNVAAWTYDEAGNVTTSTDALGNTTSYTYGPFSRLETTTDTLGNTSTNEYDAYGNLLSSTDALGNATSYEVDAYGQPTAIRRPGGATTLVEMDESGNLTSITDAEGGTTSLGYDAAGHMTSMTDANGNSRTIEVDAAGRLLSHTDPLGNRSEFAYDARGNRISASDAAGQTTLLRYDADSRLVEVEDALGNVTRTEYDAEGAATATIDARGARTEQTLDALGRTVAVTDSLGNRTTLAYCAELGGSCSDGGCAGGAGQPCCVIDPLGNVALRDYDALGRQVAETDPLGNTTTAEYDDLGRRSSVTDATGRTTRFGYDEIGRLDSVIDAIGSLTSYGFDSRGNRTSVTDANGNVTLFEYDLANRLVGERTPIGTTTSFEYDLTGQRASKLDGKGQLTRFVYDVRRQLVETQYDDGTTASFAYDERGSRTHEENQDSTRDRTYDVLGRLETVLDAETGRTIRYTYDESGNRASTAIEPDGETTTYLWDERGQLVRMTDPEGGTYRFAYDAAGRRTLTTYPNGIRRTEAYDYASRITAIVYTGPGGDVLMSFSYEMDEAGNRLSKTFEDGTSEEYGYDVLDRLVSARYPSTRFVTYDYDPVGNRERMVDDGTATTYSYNASNQLLDLTDAAGTTTFTWDGNGNQTSKAAPEGTTTYVWDARDRLSEIALPDGTAARYGYDTENLRVSMDDADGQRRILLDGLEEWGEIGEASGELLARFDHDPTRIDALLAQDTATTGRVTIVADALGSVYELVDDRAVRRARYAYDAFGQREPVVEGIETRWGYAGRSTDSAFAFLYHRARSYFPQVARFGSIDPVGPNAVHPVPSLLLSSFLWTHPYAYSSNTPTNLVDPLGLQSEDRRRVVDAAAKLVPAGLSWLLEALGLTAAFIGLRHGPSLALVSVGTFVAALGSSWSTFKSPTAYGIGITIFNDIVTAFGFLLSIFEFFGIFSSFVAAWAWSRKGLAIIGIVLGAISFIIATLSGVALLEQLLQTAQEQADAAHGRARRFYCEQRES